jgi:hypothetical protein
MSGGTVCKCPESKKPITERRWRVTARYCNYSAFSGYHWTPSNYSEVRCSECRNFWRTKAKYVSQLKNARWDEKKGDWVDDS